MYTLALLLACTPTKDHPEPSDDSTVNTSDSDSPTDSPTDSPADSPTDSPAPSAPPPSSICIIASEAPGTCPGGVYAEDWTGKVRYEWKVVDGYSTSVLTAIEGDERRPITSLKTNISWHTTGGLTVMPDGDLVLAGSTLTNVTLVVGESSTALGPDYARFIVRLSPEGEVRWVQTIIGVTGEPIMAASRSDDSVLVAGMVYQDTAFGPFTVKTLTLWDMAFAAALDSAGTWLWASAPPLPSSGNTRVYFDGMTRNQDEEAEMALRYLSSVDVNIDSFSCPAQSTCAATGTVSTSGEWTGMVAR